MEIHLTMAESTAGSDESEVNQRILELRSHILAAEAKKVDDASEAMQQITRPPVLTGRLDVSSV